MKRGLGLFLILFFSINGFSQISGTKSADFKGLKFVIGEPLTASEFEELSSLYEFKVFTKSRLDGRENSARLRIIDSTYTTKGPVITGSVRLPERASSNYFSNSNQLVLEKNEFKWASVKADKFGTLDKLGLKKYNGKYIVMRLPSLLYIFFHGEVKWDVVVDRYKSNRLEKFSALYVSQTFVQRDFEEKRIESGKLIESHEMIDVRNKCYVKLTFVKEELISEISFLTRYTFKNENGDTASVSLYPTSFDGRSDLLRNKYLYPLIEKLYPDAQVLSSDDVYYELSDLFDGEYSFGNEINENVANFCNNVNRPIYEKNQHNNRLAKQENFKKELISKYGKKYGTAIANHAVIVGMSEDMLNLSLGNAWTVTDSSVGSGYDIYHLQSKLNSAYHMKVVLKDKKVTRVSTY